MPGRIPIHPSGRSVPLRLGWAGEDITIYHKLAACDIAKGQPIVKYGEHIGLAARDIKAGEHVHCHNLEEHRENLDSKG